MDTIKVEKKGKTRFIAHRGLSGIETENTLAAFVAAGNRDYFGIETDIHRTADGKYVLFHDDSTGRICERDLRIAESDSAVVRSLRLKEPQTEDFSDQQKILFLQEYLRIVKRYDKTAVIELKEQMSSKEVRLISELCDEVYTRKKIIIISFYFENLVKMRELYPAQTLQFLCCEYSEEMSDQLSRYNLDVDIDYTQLTKERIQAYHNRGIRVNCWTCDDKNVAEELCANGVDMITTNILQ